MALSVSPGSPIFLIERTSYSVGHRPVDYEKLHYRGDHIRFKTRLIRRGARRPVEHARRTPTPSGLFGVRAAQTSTSFSTPDHLVLARRGVEASNQELQDRMRPVVAWIPLVMAARRSAFSGNGIEGGLAIAFMARRGYSAT
jgi:UTRA domain